MLTLCFRSERFGDGNWGGAITGDTIRRLLERVATLIGEGAFDGDDRRN